MQTKIIELKQAPVALVELPVGWENKRNIDGRDWIGYLLKKYHGVPLQYETLGRLLELTEEQFTECVDWYDYSHDGDLTALYAFKDYVNGIEEAGDYWDEYPFDAAKDSFYSLLESEKVYTENPYEHLKEGMTFAEECENKWQEAQSRTIDPTRTVVLIKSK